MKVVGNLTLVAMLLLATGSAVRAEFTTGLINMDFNFTPQSLMQTGPAVVGNSGDFWNSMFAHLAPLTDTTGVLTLASSTASNGVTLSLSGVNDEIIGSNPFALTPYAGLMSEGYIVTPGNTMSLTINGLTASRPYDLYLYAAGLSLESRTTTFTIGGTSRTANNFGSPSVFIEGNNYIHFLAQPADATGHLTITVQGSGGGGQFTTPGGIVNGFQIAAVPEPSTLVLIAAGGLGLLATAYRRRKAKLA